MGMVEKRFNIGSQFQNETDHSISVPFQGARQCAGINRHMVGDERALQERNSETILASSFALAIVR